MDGVRCLEGGQGQHLAARQADVGGQDLLVSVGLTEAADLTVLLGGGRPAKSGHTLESLQTDLSRVLTGSPAEAVRGHEKFIQQDSLYNICSNCV